MYVDKYILIMIARVDNSHFLFSINLPIYSSTYELYVPIGMLIVFQFNCYNYTSIFISGIYLITFWIL